jgi:AcrR family transcriptional regulator
MPETVKEEALYQAAKEQFRKWGYKKTTMEKIAGRAGISGGLISYYYKKTDFIERLFQEFLDRINAAISRDAGASLDNTYQRYILLGKIESTIIYHKSPESLKFFREIADNDLFPQSMHTTFRGLLKTALNEFGRKVNPEQFHLFCEVEFAAKVKINTDIHNGKIFIGETTVYDFFSGLVMRLAGIPENVISKNIAQANKLYDRVDYSGIDLFT